MSHSQQPPHGPADPGSGGGTGGFGPPSHLSGPLGAPSRPAASGRDRLVLGLLVASLVLGILGTAGIVYGLNNDPSPIAAAPGGADPDPTKSVTEHPTDEPTEEPTEEPTDDPTEEPTDEPTEEPSLPATDGKLKAKEYRDDWNFRLGDVKLSAKNAGSWNHRTCAPVEKDGALTAQGCRYAVEASYKARSGNLQFTHIFFVLRNDKRAEKAANSIKEEQFNIADGRFIPDFAAGKFRAGSSGNIVVVTVATRTSKVTGKVLDEYLQYAHADFKSALLFRSIG